MNDYTKPVLSAASPSPRGNGKTILIIEDEPGVREIVRRLLEVRGYRTLIAVNGSEGLGIYRQHSDKVCLVLTDMRMPGVQGTELIRELRLINPDVRIVAMSGVLGENDQIVEEPGRLIFLPKPMTLEELMGAVQRVLVGPNSAAALAGIPSR